MTDFAALAAPFPADAVSWRVGTSNKKKRQKETGDNFAKATKGIALAYIDARDVMDRFDAVCGPDGWECRYPHAGSKTVCEIAVWVEGRGWVTKADGAGDSDIEAEKGALSDSFKRAAVRWGVGRYLYHIASPWVDLDDREQISAADRRKLEALLTGSAQKPDSAAPETPKPEMTLNDRADAFIGALNKASNPAELKAAWAKGAKLCAALDTADPEKLAAIEALYRAREDELETPTPFTKAA